MSELATCLTSCRGAKGADHQTDGRSTGSFEDTGRLQTVDEFPAYPEINHGDLLGLTLGANTTSLTHGLHRFPAKYIPQVPRWALREFATEDSIVLDPFMGSGTTLVESLGLAGTAYGVDVDPLARLIARAKTSAYSITTLKKLAQKILSVEGKTTDLFLPMEGVQNVEHWFTRNTWSELCVIYRAIETLRCSAAEREFFYCVFSSILRWVSNADDQTQKTYVSGTLKKNPPPVWETFKRFLARAVAGVQDMDLQRRVGRTEVMDGSALALPLSTSSVDLIVTSPPYLDSVDYMYNFMLEYFWLGPYLGIPTRSEFNLKRRAPVGAKNPSQASGTPPNAIADLVRPDEIPPYRRAAVVAYFESMRLHFEEASRVLQDGGRYVLVVGNSQAQTGVIPVHDCLLRLSREAGLHMEKAFAYRIRRHYMKFPRKGRGGIILMDWVITLRKTPDAILSREDRLPLPNITIGEDEVAN